MRPSGRVPRRCSRRTPARRALLFVVALDPVERARPARPYAAVLARLMGLLTEGVRNLADQRLSFDAVEDDRHTRARLNTLQLVQVGHQELKVDLLAERPRVT